MNPFKTGAADHRGLTRRGLYGLAVLCLTALFVGLSAALFLCAPSLYDTYDLWFGTDIPRHIQWAIAPAYVFRSHLHPLSFLIYRSLGTLFPLLHLRSREAVFLACSFPPAFLASAAVVCAAQIARPGDRMLAGLGGVVLGSALFFAPVPESHTLGGAALLLEGTSVFWALCADPREAATARVQAAVLWGGAAAGMSLSNALPALLLLVPLWRFRTALPALRNRLGWVALAMLVVEIGINVIQARSPDPGGVNNLNVERNWLAWPTWASCRESLSSLSLHLFGLPPVHHTIHKLSWPSNPPYPLVYPRQFPSPIQCAAAACWCLGMALWWKRASSRGRAFTTACLAALLGLVAFSAAYDTFEAYMVSAHAWPFLLLPTLCLLHEAPSRRSAPALLITACVFLSALQSCLSLPHALFLLGRF